MAELKPCPFCGSRDIGMNRRTEEHHVCEDGKFRRSTLSERWQIKCENCPCGTYYSFYLEDAVNAWNKRASQTTVNQFGENCTHISNCGTLNLKL